MPLSAWGLSGSRSEASNHQECRMASDNGSAFHDPAFAGNKLLPIHRWVPWIAGFARDFVKGSLDQYLPDKGCVLDPFAGVGTTLVEAVLAGHDAIGFEINPYAALASRTKVNAHRIPLKALRVEIARFEKFYTSHVDSD